MYSVEFALGPLYGTNLVDNGVLVGAMHKNLEIFP